MTGLMHALKQELFSRYNAIKPNFRAGDTLRVYVPMMSKGKIIDKIFEGICIRVTSCTFSVLKHIGEDSVEISYSFYTPSKVELIYAGIVRRARIYYMRDLHGKKARIKRDYSRKGVTDSANH